MPKSLRYSEFLKRLRDFDVVESPNRGKGSERYLVRPTIPGTMKGPSYTIKCHGNGDTVKAGTMGACLRRLGIDPKDFWK
jgi:hypothetical protein